VLPDRAAQWVADAIGSESRITSVRRLHLGGWHVNHAVTVIDRRGHMHRLVLRRWARPGWEVDDPDYTVERETRVLELLHATPVPAPVVVAADPMGEHCDVPAVLSTRLPGHPPGRSEFGDTDRFCRQLAETLALIHGLVAAGEQLPRYRLYYDRAHATPAPWMTSTPVWERATAAVRQPPPSTAMTLIHRDYHPENSLWVGGRLSGVVDWTQASYGPRELDLAHMRWNLVADHGQAAADRFLAHYLAVTSAPLSDQPYWDLVALLDLLLDIGDPTDPGDIEPRDLRRFESYAATILADK